MGNKVPINEMIFQDAEGFDISLKIGSNYCDGFNDENLLLNNCTYVEIIDNDCKAILTMSLSLDSTKQLSDYLLEIIKYLDK